MYAFHLNPFLISNIHESTLILRHLISDPQKWMYLITLVSLIMNFFFFLTRFALTCSFAGFEGLKGGRKTTGGGS